MLTEGLKAVNDEDEDKEDGDGDDFLDEYGNLKSDSEVKSKKEKVTEGRKIKQILKSWVLAYFWLFSKKDPLLQLLSPL